jgi:hypothetical protein
MSKVVRFVCRKELELQQFRRRTIESLQPRLEAIQRQREQADLISRVCDRADHLQGVVKPRAKVNDAQLTRQVLESVNHLDHLFDERGGAGAENDMPVR